MTYRLGMPRGRSIDGKPIDYFAGGAWPFDPVEGAPEAVEYARLLAMNLTRAIGDRSIREVGELAGLDHTTVAAILKGSRWAELVTIAKLEQALETRLWPDLVE